MAFVVALIEDGVIGLFRVEEEALLTTSGLFVAGEWIESLRDEFEAFEGSRLVSTSRVDDPSLIFLDALGEPGEIRGVNASLTFLIEGLLYPEVVTWSVYLD